MKGNVFIFIFIIMLFSAAQLGSDIKEEGNFTNAYNLSETFFTQNVTQQVVDNVYSNFTNQNSTEKTVLHSLQKYINLQSSIYYYFNAIMIAFLETVKSFVVMGFKYPSHRYLILGVLIAFSIFIGAEFLKFIVVLFSIILLSINFMRKNINKIFGAKE